MWLLLFTTVGSLWDIKFSRRWLGRLCLLGYNAVYSGSTPTFPGNELTRSSGSRNKTNMKPAKSGKMSCCRGRQNIPSKRLWTSIELHGLIFQKIILFIVTAVRPWSQIIPYVPCNVAQLMLTVSIYNYHKTKHIWNIQHTNTRTGNTGIIRLWLENCLIILGQYAESPKLLEPKGMLFIISIIMWRARCRSTVNGGNACLQPLLSNATMEGTLVFFGVRSGNDVIQQ
jgi:hypothetical protein